MKSTGDLLKSRREKIGSAAGKAEEKAERPHRSTVTQTPQKIAVAFKKKSHEVSKSPQQSADDVVRVDLRLPICGTVPADHLVVRQSADANRGRKDVCISALAIARSSKTELLAMGRGGNCGSLHNLLKLSGMRLSKTNATPIL